MPTDFHADPLGWLEAFVRAGRGCAWVPGGPLCVGDARAGREILWNAEGLYREHSDFFGTPFGALPRPLQIELGQGVRQLLEAQLARADLKAGVAALPRSTSWPAAGNRLVLGLLQPALVAPHRSQRFARLVGRIVETRIYDRRPSSRLDPRRALLRRAFYAAVRDERKTAAAGPARDVLEVLAAAAPVAEPDRRLAEVYASFLFAAVGSIGLALGWSLLLACRHDALAADPADVVSEALRLFPVAWFLARRPAVEHAVLGEAVGPRDMVVVSPYAIHRNPAHWTAASCFQPDRWRTLRDRSAWTPFGAGPHACMAVAMTLRLAAELFAELRTRAPVVEGVGERPQLGAALAPPPFTVTFRA